MRDPHQFRGDNFPLQVFYALERGFFRDGEHPAHLAEGLLGVNQVSHFDDVGFVFQDPILAGQSGIQDAILDVARHFLRADQHALDFVIVDGGKIGARADIDFVARAAKKLQRGFLQASFG